MAAGPATLLSVDMEPSVLQGWQLLKSRTIAQTAVTAAKLCQNLKDVSFAEDTFDFVDVSSFGAIRFQVWGVADNNHTPVIDLYGWHDTGPGAHVGKVTLGYGNFTSAATTGFHANVSTHKSIRDKFDSTVAYRSCDVYTETADYEAAVAVTATAETDFPGYVDVDFTNNQYKWFGVAVTTLAGTNLGAIFKPLSIRRISPNFAV